MELLIGDKVWSTWSMRPWLALKHTGAPFTETLIRLRRENSDEVRRAATAAGSPSGLVPVLKDGDVTVWDSLAISEYLAERFPAAGLWPADPAARARGRSAAAEMHSGFAALREECPMDLTWRQQTSLSAAAQENVRRIVALWRDLLTRFGGPFLLGGAWSIADAFYTPVATRFRSHVVPLADLGDDGTAAAYAERLLQTPEYLEWEHGALSDERVRDLRA
ncbi:MAG TPA: glutathione S-transferase family protein [Caulobacteraceae bacterium]|nr:glutathione S-transferase family protein [Caulobacteraceae bacterium]